jgi:hypothetical protein
MRQHNIFCLYVVSGVVRRALKSRRKRWVAHVVRMGRRRSAYIILVERPDRKRPLGRPMLNWKDNINMNLQAMG